jgi:hypothetical protein
VEERNAMHSMKGEKMISHARISRRFKMQEPTLEQEKQELEEVNKLLVEYEAKRVKYHRLANALHIMAHTIRNSIKERTLRSVSLSEHKEEIDETKVKK